MVLLFRAATAWTSALPFSQAVIIPIFITYVVMLMMLEMLMLMLILITMIDDKMLSR